MQWQISSAPVDYPTALAVMEQRVHDILETKAPELVWLLEHPPLYTSGTSAKSADLLEGKRFPIYQAGRGGEWTYHGPGQRIAYVMLDLNKRGRDVRAYVQSLERWVIAALQHFGVEGFTREGRVGVWVNRMSDVRCQMSKNYLASDIRHPASDSGEAKIAALGIRVRKWITYHGIALNVAPDLEHYNGIIPCGISAYGVTSLAALGIEVPMREIDAVLLQTFGQVIG